MPAVLSAPAPTPAPTLPPNLGRRVRIAMRWVLLADVLVAAAYVSQGRPHVALILVASALLLLGGCSLLLRGDRATAAADWMLAVLTLTCATLALAGQGLRDTALFAFPGLLVYTALLRTRTVLIALLSGQLALLLGIGLLGVSGLMPPRVEAPRLLQLVDIGVLLLLTAFAVWHLARNLREALGQAAVRREEMELALAALQSSSRRDALTGLPNRVAAKEQVEALLQQNGAEAALLNLDGFATLNEAFGAEVGDELLAELARRLRDRLAPEDQLFRLGADEFLVARAATADGPSASWARRLSNAMEQPIAAVGIELACSACVGLASAHRGEVYEKLLHRADLAMRAARLQGRGSLRHYAPAMDVDQAQHLSLLAAMRRSLQEGSGFALHFQPKVELVSGRVVGAEALLRWQAPGYGTLGPAQFVPLAEHSGLIVELGAWMLGKACRQAAAWRAQGWSDFRIAVNVSTVQLRRADFATRVLAILRDEKLPGEALLLELTESVFSERHGDEAQQLQRLREAGVALAIDDFGTGYSNLGYLARLPVQLLKIDQGFVRAMSRSDADRGIVETIITLARRLGLTTVAEGIETPAQAELLQQLGCEMGQGYLWAPALPADVFWFRYGRRDELRPAGTPG